MDVFECIRNRRSIRKFTEQPVEFSKLAQVMEAGRWAPSAGNIQNWRFILVNDKSTIKRAYEHCLHQKVVYHAQALIIVCSTPEKAERLYGLRGKRLYTVQNCSASVQNMLLAAHGLGLGACWIGAFNEDDISAMFGIPSNARPQAILAIGYPDEEPESERKDLASFVHFGKYGMKIKDLHMVLRDYSIQWKKSIDSIEEHGEKGLKKLFRKISEWWNKRQPPSRQMRSVLEKNNKEKK